MDTARADYSLYNQASIPGLQVIPFLTSSGKSVGTVRAALRLHHDLNLSSQLLKTILRPPLPTAILVTPQPADVMEEAARALQLSKDSRMLAMASGQLQLVRLCRGLEESVQRAVLQILHTPALQGQEETAAAAQFSALGGEKLYTTRLLRALRL